MTSLLITGANRGIGRAFAAYVGGQRYCVGRDMRVSSPDLAEAFIRGFEETALVNG